MKYCVRCCMPAANEGIAFDEMGVCQACQSAEQKMRIDWTKREAGLRELFEHYQSLGNDYDCIVPISGGKDSVAGETNVWTTIDGTLYFLTMRELRDRLVYSRVLLESNGQRVGVPKDDVRVLTSSSTWQRFAEPEFVRLNHIMWHEIEAPMYRVTLSNGREVVTTGDHSVMRIPPGRGGVHACRTTELEPGNPMLALCDVNIEGRDAPVPDWLLYLGGLWTADGCYAVDRKIVISTGGNPKILEFLSQVPRSLTNVERAREALELRRASFPTLADATRTISRDLKIARTTVHSAAYYTRDRSPWIYCHVKDNGDVWLGDKRLVERMQSLGFVGKSHTKRVPDWLFTASRRQVGLFLAGYLDGDGSISTRGVEVGTVSEELALGVRRLLWRLGAKHGYSVRPPSGGYSSCRPSYRITITAADALERLVTWVPTRKARIVVRDRATATHRHYGFQQLTVERVEELTSQRRTVYDLDTDNDRFVANGILVHNSTFQLHVVTQVYGLRALAVTFSHNWYTETGRYNLENALEKFDVDHVMFTPKRSLVNRLARESLLRIGDSCWHCHAGVGAFPLQAAVKWRIPLLVWGESAADLSGRDDYDKRLYKFDRDYFTKISAKIYADEMAEADSIDRRELTGFQFPTAEECEAEGVVGIHLSDYIWWDDERQMEFVRDVYGWREDTIEGTYKGYKSVECRMAGVHDYTKFQKRGFGRGTDHASVDVRAGLLTREEAFELAKRHDTERPDALDYYLEITGFTEHEFDVVLAEYRESLAIEGLSDVGFDDIVGDYLMTVDQ